MRIVGLPTVAVLDWSPYFWLLCRKRRYRALRKGAAGVLDICCHLRVGFLSGMPQARREGRNDKTIGALSVEGHFPTRITPLYRMGVGRSSS